jgi:hypothetical protein
MDDTEDGLQCVQYESLDTFVNVLISGAMVQSITAWCLLECYIYVENP